MILFRQTWRPQSKPSPLASRRWWLPGSFGALARCSPWRSSCELRKWWKMKWNNQNYDERTYLAIDLDSPSTNKNCVLITSYFSFLWLFSICLGMFGVFGGTSTVHRHACTAFILCMQSWIFLCTSHYWIYIILLIILCTLYYSKLYYIYIYTYTLYFTDYVCFRCLTHMFQQRFNKQLTGQQLCCPVFVWKICPCAWTLGRLVRKPHQNRLRITVGRGRCCRCRENDEPGCRWSVDLFHSKVGSMPIEPTCPLLTENH